MRPDPQTNVSSARSRSGGFTLIEIAVVLAIIAIFAALAVASLGEMAKRASFSGVAGDLITGLRRTQQEASARGVYTTFVIDTAGNRWWGVQTDQPFDLSTFDPSNPGNVIVSGTLPSTVTFPAAGYGTDLPAPFDGVPITSGSPNFAYCSFCDSTSKMGAVMFEPGGAVRFNSGPNTVGQQFTIQFQYKQMTDLLAVAIIGRTGLIETFRK